MERLVALMYWLLDREQHIYREILEPEKGNMKQ